MRRLVPVLVSLAAAAATVIATAPSAEAASYPRMTFRVEYGQTYTTGTVTFYNRAVVVEGEQKAVSSSGCRKTGAQAVAGGEQLGRNEWAWTCSGSEKFSFTVPANRPGGADRVFVNLFHTTSVGSGTQQLVGSSICMRGQATCV
jgi:hypothetical protein